VHEVHATGTRAESIRPGANPFRAGQQSRARCRGV